MFDGILSWLRREKDEAPARPRPGPARRRPRGIGHADPVAKRARKEQREARRIERRNRKH